jgi:hypothetical protein
LERVIDQEKRREQGRVKTQVPILSQGFVVVLSLSIGSFHSGPTARAVRT